MKASRRHTEDETGPPPDAVTSIHVRRAREGDAESIEWLVKRFSGLLFVNARYRLHARSARHYDPEDVVNDVWAIALPKLADLAPRDGRVTPVVLKFLSTTLIYRCNDLLKKHLRERELGASETGTETRPREHVLPAETTAAISRLVRRERSEAVAAAIDDLAERERELVILRGIEQQPYREIAATLGGDEKSLSVAYGRALKKLRRRLSGTVLEEIDE